MGGNTPEHIKGDQLARAAQGRVGHPPGVVLKQMVSDNMPKNMPIGLDNVADALAIYGPPVSRLKGANTREKTHTRVGEGGKLEIPRDFYQLNKFVTLTTGYIFGGNNFDLSLERDWGMGYRSRTLHPSSRSQICLIDKNPGEFQVSPLPQPACGFSI